MEQAQITSERQVVVNEAMTWIGTPYQPNARIKGAGCDCLTFIAGVFQTILGPIAVPYYPPDWHLNQMREWYIEGIVGLSGVEVTDGRDPLPGDIVLWKHGNCYAHGAIVTQWTSVVHAYSRRPVGIDDAVRRGPLSFYFEPGLNRGKPRPRRLFTLARWVI